MKRKIISLLILASSTLSFATSAFAGGFVPDDFKDVPEAHWAYNDIFNASMNGFVQGVGDGNFAPSKNVTYAEWIKMVANVFETGDKPIYKSNPWWYSDTRWLMETHVLDGTKFYNKHNGLIDTYTKDEVNNPINRFEMAQIIYNIANRPSNEKQLVKIDNVNTDGISSKIPDYNSIPAQYRDAVEFCYASGLITGIDKYGQFVGYATMDRASAATVLNRLFDAKLGKLVAPTNTGSNTTEVTPTPNTTPEVTEPVTTTPKGSEHKYPLGNNKDIYAGSRYGTIVYSDLYENSDGTISTVFANSGTQNINIEIYDKDFNLLSGKQVPYELPLFGGFYNGKTYNYIIFGQENKEENDSKETFRIVKYDKNFNKIDSCSITGKWAQTTVPFDAGSLRMDEYNDYLYINTARSMYKSSDGLNHQSNFFVKLDTNDMTFDESTYLNRGTEPTVFHKNYVSHSFDEFVNYDKDIDKYVLVDLGDAYPRAIVMQREITETKNKESEELQILKIPGSIGDNNTGISMGGFSISTNNYLVMANRVNFKLTSDESYGRDVVLYVVDKNKFSENNVKEIVLQDYTSNKDVTTSLTPTLVKISNDKFVAMWAQSEGIRNAMNYKTVKYVFIDGEGNKLSDVKTLENTILSKDAPTVIDNNLTWFVDDNETRQFYKIPIK